VASTRALRCTNRLAIPVWTAPQRDALSPAIPQYRAGTRPKQTPAETRRTGVPPDNATPVRVTVWPRHHETRPGTAAGPHSAPYYPQ